MASLRIAFVLASAGALTAAGCSKDEGREQSRTTAEMTQGGEQGRAQTEGQGEVAQTESQMEMGGGADQPGAARDEQAGAKAAATLTDNEIARIADVVNTGEIEQAQLALTKAQHPRVKQYAQLMIESHSEAKRETANAAEQAALIPEDSSMSSDVQNESQEIMHKLREARGSEFDREYIKAQIEQHQQALDMIEKELLPSADNQEIRDELENTREMVQEHLDEAREIQEELATGPGR